MDEAGLPLNLETKLRVPGHTRTLECPQQFSAQLGKVGVCSELEEKCSRGRGGLPLPSEAAPGDH